MASSFAVGGTTVTFLLVDHDGFKDTGGVGQDIEAPVVLSSVADYNTLATLITREISVKYPPSGTAPVIDLGFGAGAGSLAIDNVAGSPFTAALKDLSRPSAYPDGKVRATGVFVKTA